MNEYSNQGSNKTGVIVIVVVLVVVVFSGIWYFAKYKPEQEAKEQARLEQIAQEEAEQKKKEQAARNKARFDQLIENADAVNRDHVENKKWAIAPSIGFGLDSDTRLFLNYLYTEQDNVIDGGVSTVGLESFDASRNENYADIADYLNSNRVDASTFYGSADDFDDVEANMATLRIEHDISEVSKLTSAVRWGRMTHKYLATIPTSFVVNGDAEDTQVNRSGNNGDTVNKILTSQTPLVLL